MTESELLEVLSDFNDVYLSGPDGEVEIEPQMSILMNKDGSDYETRVSGYKITVHCGAKSRGKTVKCKKLLSYIKKKAYFENGEFKLFGIGADRKSYEKYLADNDFNKIDMAGLLDIYGDIANSFSLTCPYNGYDEKGEVLYKISDGLAEIAEREIRLWARNSSREQLKNCENLPPFDELYAEIEREYEEFYLKNEEFAKQHGGNAFICDAFARGETEFTQPSELWHVYNSVEFAANCVRTLRKMKEATAEKPLCTEIDGEEVLKFNLQDVKVGFSWHCTVSSELGKTFFFELNEDTKKWLMRHKDDYDFGTLQDLAFYNGEKILFSSCTHEGFHTDLREVKNG